MIKTSTISKRAMAYYYRWKEFEETKARMQEEMDTTKSAEKFIQYEAILLHLRQQRKQAYDALLRICATAADDYPEER